jgi:hypothetical protein
VKSSMSRRFVSVVIGVALLGGGLVTAAHAADVTYVQEVVNGGFETPALADRTDEYRPTGGSWLFGGEAGLSRSSSGFTNGAPAFPDGAQVAFVQRAGKIVQQIWLEPGDVLTVRATQRVSLNTSLQSLSVVLDGVPQGAPIVAPRGSWGSYEVPLAVAAAPRRMNLEIRGNVKTTDATAFVDAVAIRRTAVAIPDGGLPALTQRPMMNTRTQPMAAGVLGVLKTGDSESSVDTPVQAFAEWTNPATGQAVVFVGGKFSSVQRGAGAPQQNQRYLGAFDRGTGAWIDTFRPTLDGTVWTLAVVGNRLFVGGQFTNVNGAPRTAGLAALDPATGAVLAGWNASLTLTGSSIRPFVRSIDAVGDHLYVGGLFTRVTGPDGVIRTAGNLDKLNVSNGIPVPRWNGTVNGHVYDIDATPTRVYAVGKFSTVNGAARRSLAILEPSNGASVPGLNQMLFTTTDTARMYQQAVHAVGDVVVVGGSQHSTQVYRASDLVRLRVVTTDPLGDTQAIASAGGFVYYGSHANSRTFAYTDGTTWPGVTGWTTRDATKWMGALDTEAGYSFVPTWVPQVGVANGEGGWELFVDSTGCMWAGGDFNRGSSTANGTMYAQGFTKFCPVDSVAPTTPRAATATPGPSGVSMTWGASIDDRVGPIRFEVLRNDRPIATGLSTRSFVDPAGTSSDRYFIRAYDQAGNRSATTAVVIAGVDTIRPAAPTGFAGMAGADGQAVLVWNASTDNIGVTGYRVYRDGSLATTVTGLSATVTGLPAGATSFQVSAIDAAGNESLRSASLSVTISGPDVSAPSVPRDLVGSSPAVGEVFLSWSPSVDDVAVAGYNVVRNGSFVETTTQTSITLTGLGGGVTGFQVSAFDAAGNESARTASVSVTVAALDVTRPSVPRDLVIVPGADGEAVLTWSPSTDNVGVTGYRIHRSGVFVTEVVDTTATVAGLPVGSNSFQVSAFDAAGNESARTASVTVMVTGPDTVRPSTPTGLVATVQPDGSVAITWTASRDNVAVAGYLVHQTGVVVQSVATNSATVTGLAAGNHWFQVQAFDAAGNLSLRTPSVLVTI